MILTLILVIGCDGENSMLDVFILINLSLVEQLVKVGRVVVLVGNPYPDKPCDRVGLSFGVGPGRRRSVPGLDIESIRPLKQQYWTFKNIFCEKATFF